MGIRRVSGQGHAIEYWNKWHYSGSTSMNNIPIGAAVISNPTKGNDWYGHIGIYVGGGKVVSNLGYKCVESVQSFASRGRFTGWVWPYGKHI